MADHLDREFADEFIDQMFIENVFDILDKYEIKKKPKESTLHSFLASYTKEKLFALADENDIEITKKWKKAYLVEYMHHEIMETIEERLLILGEENLSLLQKFKFHLLYEKELRDDEKRFYWEVYPKAVRMGLLFSIDKDTEIVTMMPDDLLEMVNDILNNFAETKKKHQAQIRVWEQLEEALNAGVNLYGAVSRSVVMKLWKICHPDPNRTFEEEMEFFSSMSDIIPMLAIRNDYYFVEKHIIGNHLLTDEAEVSELYWYTFNKMKINGKFIEYYEPTQQEIRYFSKHSFDRRTVVYKKLKRLVSKLSVETDIAMNFIEFSIQKGYPLSIVMDELNTFNFFHFNTEKQLETFVDLYTQLSNNTRLWENAGYTPTELFEIERALRMHENEKIAEIQEEDENHANIIPMAHYKEEKQEQQSTRSKKIGRNDPCPCGSGKKYKKCCMKKNR